MGEDAAAGEGASVADAREDIGPEVRDRGEAPPRTRRKEDYGQRSPLIRLTPFLEEQRRAMVSGDLKASDDKLGDLISTEVAALGRLPQEVVSQGTPISSGKFDVRSFQATLAP
jgi:hypothetical protein